MLFSYLNCVELRKKWNENGFNECFMCLVGDKCMDWICGGLCTCICTSLGYIKQIKLSNVKFTFTKQLFAVVYKCH